MREMPFSDDELDELREAFALFDKDGDGDITRDEMAAVMRGFGQDLDARVLRPLFDGADANGDGRLQWSEFIDLIQGLDEDNADHRALHETLMIFLTIRGG